MGHYLIHRLVVCCDRCQATRTDEGGSEGQMLDATRVRGWLISAGLCICPGCVKKSAKAKARLLEGLLR